VVVAGLCALAVAVLPVPARAGIVDVDADRAGPGSAASDVRLTVRDPGRPPRMLGPWRLAGTPDRVVPSPDGRTAVLLPEVPDPRRFRATRFWIVPLDGSAPPRAIPVPAGLALSWPTGARWSADGSRLLIDHVAVRPRSAAARAGRDPWRWRVLECDPPAGACATVPGAAGFAAPLDGGRTLSASSSWAVQSVELMLSGDSDAGLPRWTSADGRVGRLMARAVTRPRRVGARIDGPDARVLAAQRRPLRRGVVYATNVALGPRGALVVRARDRTVLRRSPGGRVGLRQRVRLAPLLAVDASGGTRPLSPSGWTTRFRPLPAGRAVRARDLTFAPAVGLPDGRWLGTLERPLTGYPHAIATMDAVGTTQPLRVAGQPATAEVLLRSVRLSNGTDGPVPPSVIGYERTTGSAVVAILRWADDDIGGVVLRVPLDGSAPTIAATGLTGEGQEFGTW
jgi:hypothetical protein